MILKNSNRLAKHLTQSVALLASSTDTDLADMAFMYGRNIGKQSYSFSICRKKKLAVC
jgi:hypothetical protein